MTLYFSLSQSSDVNSPAVFERIDECGTYPPNRQVRLLVALDFHDLYQISESLHPVLNPCSIPLTMVYIHSAYI